MAEMTRTTVHHRRQWRYTAAVVGDGPWTYEASALARQTIHTGQQRSTENYQAAAQRHDYTTAEQCQMQNQCYSDALGEIAARDMAAMRRVLWENQERERRNHYEWVRYRHASDILSAARRGDLNPNWRRELPAPTPDMPELLRAAHTAAITDLAKLPPQPWEPHEAGDWRTALDAWHHDSLTVLDRYYRNQLAHAATPFARYGPAEAPELDEREAQRRASVTTLATNLERAERARIDDAYRAGIAAGENPADDAPQPLPGYWLPHAPA